MSAMFLSAAGRPGMLGSATHPETPMRRLAILAIAALVAGCTPDVLATSFSPTGVPTDEFGVTSLAGTPKDPAYASFNNADPGAGALMARQLCTLGTELGDEVTLPGDAADFRFQSVRCAPYRLSILPPI
jgi:hypothetical protein